MSSEELKRVNEALGALGIKPGAAFEHAAVATADEHRAVAGHLNGQLTKNLFLKGGKGSARKEYLVTLRSDRAVDLTALAKAIGAAGGVRFAEPELLLEKLGVTPGSVTPLALLNDKKKETVMVLDAALVEASAVPLVHPLVNTATVGISGPDLHRFCVHYAKEVKVVEADKLAPAPKEPKAAGDAEKPKEPKEPKEKKPAAAAAAAAAAPAAAGGAGAGGADADTQVALPRKSEDFANWYSALVVRSELIEYYDVSGCYILRPSAYSIWESIQGFFDGEIKKLGVRNCYFPLFVTEAALTSEKDHVEGFAPEVAWVTRAGDTKLDKPLAVRPTSETIMYPAVAKWVRSYRDLPVRLNQWSNVVRWEFKYPTPFIRSREFLWQEGHSTFATKAEADEEVLQILDLYAQVYENLLAVPVIKGRKTENEKFAGGLYTTTVEAFIPAIGRGVQGATSHSLGQNFAKMFNITFLDDKDGEDGSRTKTAWQNSWGLTTRTIGVMIMVHGDDKGLVLPPRVAPTQVVIIPLYYKDEAQNRAIDERARELAATLRADGVRVEIDDRKHHNPGWKFAEWELRGVPLQIRVGPKDLTARTYELVRRDTLDRKLGLPYGSALSNVQTTLTTMQREMLERARKTRDQHLVQVETWAQFMDALQRKCTPLAPWCGVRECETAIKNQSGIDSKDMAADSDDPDAGRKLTGAAKSLCIPFAQPELRPGAKCVKCGCAATCFTLFGRSY